MCIYQVETKLQRIMQCHARSNQYLWRYTIFPLNLPKAILEAEISPFGGHSPRMEAEYPTIEQDPSSLAGGNSVGTQPCFKNELFAI